MEDYKEITGDKNRIDCQLGCKQTQALGGILFHEERLRERR
jgi:hypothetical protein